MNESIPPCKSFHDFGDDWDKFLAQDPLCVFRKGACHAFAIELHRLLKTEPRLGVVKLLELRKGDNPVGGDHIVVGVGSRYLDVQGTLMTSNEVSEKWGTPAEISEEELTKEYNHVQITTDYPDDETAPDESDPILVEAFKSKFGSRSSQEPKSGSHDGSSMNRFGHRIDNPFFSAARCKAKEYLKERRDDYIRLGHEAFSLLAK